MRTIPGLAAAITAAILVLPASARGEEQDTRVATATAGSGASGDWWVEPAPAPKPSSSKGAGRALVIGGAAGFGASYLGSVVAALVYGIGRATTEAACAVGDGLGNAFASGASSSSSSPSSSSTSSQASPCEEPDTGIGNLVYPVAGPFMAMAAHRQSAAGYAILTADGVMQVGGIAALLTGIGVLTSAHYPRSKETAIVAPRATPKPTWRAVPSAPGTTAGASLVLSF